MYKMGSLKLTMQVSISMSREYHFGQRTIFYLLAGQLCQTLNTLRIQAETFSFDSDESTERVECSVCKRYIPCWKYLCEPCHAVFYIQNKV